MFELAAISIGDDGENVVSVAGSAKLNLSNAGEILAKNVGVLRDRSSKLVKIDFLEEIEIRRGALTGAGIARVIEAGSDGGEAFRVDYIWIYDYALRFWREIRIEADQERLLFGGLELQEKLSRPVSVGCAI